MPKITAGLLMYRFNEGAPEFFLVHPGGPFFKNKDKGFWSIPKGFPEEGEEGLAAACREFNEETGMEASGPFTDLGEMKYSSGHKIVTAWAFEGNWDPEQGIASNLFTMEWPPKSGKQQQFPETDRAAWFTAEEAKKKIQQNQAAFIDRLLAEIG